MQLHHYFTPKKPQPEGAESPLIKRAATLECTPVSKRARALDASTPPSVRRQAKRSQTRLFQAKIVSDVVYNTIQIDPLCEDIIDTPQFQRLHHLKQLGTCDYVFRGATHTRFAHSLGVAHLAEKLVSSIRRHQSYLGITDVDVLCVKVAGLCHDLGHGPFSHVFDGVFMKQMWPDGVGADGTMWKHEQGSVMMFRYLLENDGIDIAQYGLSDVDRLFIEEMIEGVPENDRRGRPPSKAFLYDVVNNVRSGLDVDKLDYFQRDMQTTHASTPNINFERFIELARVLRAEGENGEPPTSPMICYPEKLVVEAFQLFHFRYTMHQQVYTHKAVKQVEFMVTDALISANEHIRVPGKVTDAHPDGLYKLSEAALDPAAYTLLTDSILNVIQMNTDPGLAKAKELIDRINTRQLYVYVGRTPLKSRADPSYRKSEDSICREIINAYRRRASTHELLPENSDEGSPSIAPFPIADDIANGHDQDGGVELTEDDLIVEKMAITFGGKKGKHPVEMMRFFPKEASADTLARKFNAEKYEAHLPRRAEELSIRVFCRDADKEDAAKEAFHLWCRYNQCPSPLCSQLSQNDY